MARTRYPPLGNRVFKHAKRPGNITQLQWLSRVDDLELRPGAVSEWNGMKASSTSALCDFDRVTSPTPCLSPIQIYLQQLHARYAGLTDGDVATYIPELAKADPDWFGCCLVTTDGQVYAVGDSDLPFTIQSISKPFVYATALADSGKEAVLNKIGIEPTGDAFNAISLHPNTGQPSNPMINAGAIATTGLVA